MGKIIDTIERALWGATAAERVDMMVELATRRAEARLVAALERLTADDANGDDDDTSAQE